MARKRLNKRFLVILLVAVVVLIGGGVLAVTTLRAKPSDNVARAKQHEAAGEYDQAFGQYARAIHKLRTDPDMWVAFGDAAARLTTRDDRGEKLGSAWNAYNQAIQVNPSHVPALRRKLGMLMDQVRLGTYVLAPPQQTFEDVRATAGRLAELEPADPTHRTVAAGATVRETLLPGVTPPTQRVEEAITTLRQAVEAGAENPTAAFDPDTALMLSISELRQARASRQDRDSAAADAALARAEAVFPPLLENRADDVRLIFRAAQIDSDLASQYPAGSPRQQAARVRADARFAAAGQLVTPDHPEYTSIRLSYADALIRADDTEAAERVLRELITARPYDSTGRLALAELLTRGGREGRTRAVAVLAEPLEISEGTVSGIEGVALIRGRDEVEAVLVEYRVKAAFDATADRSGDAATRQRLIDEAQRDFERLLTRSGETAFTLRLKGELQRLNNRNVEAVSTLTRAYALSGDASVASGAQLRNRLETMFALAQAQLAVNQTGQARQLLQELAAAGGPNFPPARRLLIDLLLRERDFDAARAEAERLVKEYPQSEVDRQILLATYANDAAGGDALLAQMPENTPQEARRKLESAVRANQLDDAERLAARLHAEDATDQQVAVLYARLLTRQERVSDALAVLDRLLERTPDAEAVRQMRTQLAASPAERQAMVEAIVGDIDDPYTRLVRQAQIAAARGENDRSVELLRQADATAGETNTGQAAELLFAHALSRGDFAASETYLRRLEQTNRDGVGGRTYRVAQLAAAGQSADAVTLAESLTRDYPQLASSWRSAAVAYRAAGDLNRSAEAFGRAVQIQPTNAVGIRGLIETYAALGRTDEARRAIDEGRRLHPNDPEFERLAYAWEMEHGDPRQAIAPLRQALDANRDDVNRWATLGTTYLRAYRAASGRDESAAKSFLNDGLTLSRQAYEKFPTEPQVVALFSDFSRYAGDPLAGEAALRRLISDRPEDETVALMLAQYLVNLSPDRRGEAADVLREHVARRPGADRVRLALVDVLLSAGRGDEALAAVSEGDLTPAARSKRLELLVLLGRNEEAARVVEAELRRERTLPMLNAGSLIAIRNGDLDAAQRYVDEAFRLAGADPTALFRRAQIRLTREVPDVEGAIGDLIAVRDAIPDNFESRLLLAEAYVTRGSPEAAAGELEAALRLNPGHKAVRLRLADVYTRQTPPRYAQAERLLREAQDQPALGLANDPDFPLAESLIATARGEHRPAAEAARRAYDYAAAAGGGDSRYLAQLLSAMTRAGQHREVMRMTEPMVSRGSNGAASLAADSWLIREARGSAQAAMRQPEPANAEFAAALAAARATNNLGATERVLRTVASTSGIDHAIRMADDLLRTDSRFRLPLADLLSEQGRTDDAIALLRPLLDDADQPIGVQVTAYQALGNYHLTADPPRVEEARQAYERVIRHHPDNPVVLNNLAYTLTRPGAERPQEALAYSQQAYDLMSRQNQRDPLLLDTHGWVLVLNGRVDEGLPLLLEAADRQPQPDILLHVGEAYLRSERPGEAVRALRQARDMTVARQSAGERPNGTLVRQIESALSRAEAAAAGQVSVR